MLQFLMVASNSANSEALDMYTLLLKKIDGSSSDRHKFLTMSLISKT